MKLTLMIVLAATLAALAIAQIHQPRPPRQPQKVDDDDTLLASLQPHDDDTLLSSLQTQFESSMQNDMKTVRYIRITQPASNHLCFSWLACYDLFGNNVCADRNKNTASGNGNPHPDPWGLSAPVLSSVENTGTQTGNCYCSAQANAGNYWQVDLGNSGVALKTIKYRTRNDAASYGFSVLITLWDKDNKQIDVEGAKFTTSASQTTTQTFDVASFLGYTGKHDEHLSPVVALLHSLKDKLRNSKKITADRLLDLTGESKKAEKAAEIALGAMNEAVKIDSSEGARTSKELEMIDSILAMVHTLNGKK